MNVLVSGLGGGLDIVNASLLYFLFKHAQYKVFLGSIRPTPLSFIKHKEIIHTQACLLSPKSQITYRGRYAEPYISKIINQPVILFSRKGKGNNINVKGLRNAIQIVIQEYKVDFSIFVDGDNIIIK